MIDTETPWSFNSKRLDITKGITGDGQEGSFMNATLQSAQGGELEFSVAIYIDVPETVRGEDALADFLGHKVFGEFVHQHPEASVVIQLGPAGDGEEED